MNWQQNKDKRKLSGFWVPRGGGRLCRRGCFYLELGALCGTCQKPELCRAARRAGRGIIICMITIIIIVIIIIIIIISSSSSSSSSSSIIISSSSSIVMILIIIIIGAAARPVVQGWPMKSEPPNPTRAPDNQFRKMQD